MNFVRYNANPKGKKTGDCVIRAIGTGLQIGWEQTYIEMLDIALETGYAVSCKENYVRYLKLKGYEKQKMPKHSNNKRYTVKEFIDELTQPDKTYIIDVANHVTVVSKKTLYDLWDCSYKSVCNYWIIDGTFEHEQNYELHKRRRLC